MSYARLVPTLAAAGVCLTALGAAGVADAASTAGTPRPPGRYRVVISPELAAPDGADTRGTVRCPTGTVPLGGAQGHRGTQRVPEQEQRDAEVGVVGTGDSGAGVFD